MLKHNKKRNIGLLSEFLSRHIASCFVDKKDKEIDVAQNIWLSHIGNEKSELAKEHALFNALYRTNVKNKEVAASLMESVKQHCLKQDAKKLDQEKTKLIQEIKSSIKDDDFFSREVSDYRTCATIQILMNSWRENSPAALSETTALEDQVLAHLVCENKFPEPDPTVLEMKEQDIDGLVVGIMTEKFNKKYEKTLTEDQKEIVNLYIFSSEKDRLTRLSETLKEVRLTTLSYIDFETRTSENKRVANKLEKVKNLLEGKYRNVEPSKINDDLVAFYMTTSKLREELMSNNETA